MADQTEEIKAQEGANEALETPEMVEKSLLTAKEAELTASQQAISDKNAKILSLERVVSRHQGTDKSIGEIKAELALGKSERLALAEALDARGGEDTSDLEERPRQRESTAARIAKLRDEAAKQTTEEAKLSPEEDRLKNMSMLVMEQQGWTIDSPEFKLTESLGSFGEIYASLQESVKTKQKQDVANLLAAEKLEHQQELKKTGALSSDGGPSAESMSDEQHLAAFARGDLSGAAAFKRTKEIFEKEK